MSVLAFTEWQVLRWHPLWELKPRERDQGRNLPSGFMKTSPLWMRNFDSKKTLKELITAIKCKPSDSASPKPQLIGGYGVHPPINMGAAGIGLFFSPPPPGMYPPLSQQSLLHASPVPITHVPLDLSHTGQYKEETDDTPDEVADDVNESLGRLEEENPNLADPLTDPILDQAATSLARWFRNPCPHG